MLEHRIPAAKPATAAIVGDSCFHGLIVINIATAGRLRTFGPGGGGHDGVAGGTLPALIGSMTGEYATEGVVDGAGSMIGVVLAAGLVLSALPLIRARQARTARGDH